MTRDELRAACGDGKGSVTLRIAREGARGPTVRLNAQSGPRGIVTGYRDGGVVLVRFSSRSLLRWLDATEQNERRKARQGK